MFSSAGPELTRRAYGCDLELDSARHLFSEQYMSVYTEDETGRRALERVTLGRIGTEYFEALGIAVRGRTFTESDIGNAASVAIVSEPPCAGCGPTAVRSENACGPGEKMVPSTRWSVSLPMPRSGHWAKILNRSFICR